ncbi:hypothetical protein Dimus_038764 [Dionaea muscipula]
MFFVTVIPGPSNPKKLNVYLQPLIDELKNLWQVGVDTWNISKKTNFRLRAALMWIISDFPTYGMLSGWGTTRKLACPYCMENSKAFSLSHGRKTSFFDCYRQFLASNHAFRRDKKSFYKGRVERSLPPPGLTGEEIFNRV